MKKRTVHFLLFLLMVSLLAPSQKSAANFDSRIQDYGVNENEPNNSFGSANYTEPTQYIKGMFQESQDVDVYSFDVYDESNRIAINVDIDKGIQPSFTLHDHHHKVMTPIYVEEFEYYQYFEFELNPPEPGEVRSYYLTVREESGTASNARYGWSAIPYSEDQLSIERLSGNDRYETSAAISEYGWPTGSDHVILARDITFPDALAGAPLGYHLDAPILLNPSNKLHDTIRDEITRLGASTVTILGGETAISQSVENYLRDKMKLTVKRVAGKDRYETAAKIAGQLGGYNQAMVVDGRNFPDALSGAPYAAAYGMPILLTEKDQLPGTTKSALNGVSATYVIGGTSAISESVKMQVPSPTRISGLNRYETSVNIAREFAMSGESAFLATGENFADALSGSVLAGFLYEPILLVKTHEIPQVTMEYLAEYGTYDFTILGGETAVSPGVVLDIVSLFE